MLQMMRVIFFGLVMTVAFPVYCQVHSYGQFAQDLMGPVGLLGDFVQTGSIAIGAMCLFGALIRYKEYRINPYTTPFSTVITLILLGVILLGLPFVYLLTGSGLPYPHK